MSNPGELADVPHALRRRAQIDYTQALTQQLRTRVRRRTGRSASSARYASAHAWEDWAETWAHYLHMVDTLETAAARRPGAQAATAATSRR